MSDSQKIPDLDYIIKKARKIAAELSRSTDTKAVERSTELLRDINDAITDCADTIQHEIDRRSTQRMLSVTRERSGS